MPAPLIDVGDPQQCAFWPVYFECHGVAVFFAVWHLDELNPQPIQRFARLPRLHWPDIHLAIFNDLRPRIILLQKARHPRRDMQRHVVGRGDFFAELHQPGVMTDVRMGNEHAIDRLATAARDACQRMEHRDLRLNRRRCFN